MEVQNVVDASGASNARRYYLGNDLAVLVAYTPAVLFVASRLVRSPWRNITVACGCKLA